MKPDQKQRDLLISQLKERVAEAERKGQIDNSRLPAGSPMYYYCKVCGLLADTKPENWFASLPRQYCDPCNRMITEYDMIVEELHAVLRA